MRILLAASFVAAFPGLQSACLAAEPIVPRSLLFGDPVQTNAIISPDGRKIAYLSPDHGALNIWVRSRVSESRTQPVTHDRGRGIHEFRWQSDSTHLLYLQDQGGEENFHVYQVDMGGSVRDLTPYPKVHAQIVAGNGGEPNRLLVSMNLRDPKWPDVYSVDLKSGSAKLDTVNPGEADGFIADEQLKIRIATRTTADGGAEILVRREDGRWTVQKKWPSDQSFAGVYGFSADGRTYFVLASAGAEATRLIGVQVSSGEETTIGDAGRYDVDSVSFDPITRAVDAFRWSGQKENWTKLTPKGRKAFPQLGRACTGEIGITGRSANDEVWTVSCESDRRPKSYSLYFPKSGRVQLLFSDQPGLNRYRFASMTPINFAARDGMRLHGYLTLPAGPTRGPRSTVILVHGGPWARDTWGFKPDVQLLANRGYAVLQVNYRGSTGYGHAYLDAGDREWGNKMELDLIDAKNWAVAHGWSDPKRVAIMGASYGGYAALAGLAFYPSAFASAVDMVGPSDLSTLKDSYASFFTAMRRTFAKRVGDDAAFLKQRSPLYAADRIEKPLLIAQSTNDVHVTLDQGDRIVSRLRKNGQNVRYLVIGDEGHTLSKANDRLYLVAEIERFLARTLGGRIEPYSDAVPTNIQAK